MPDPALLTILQRDERQAMAGQRTATLRVVAALREYRQAAAVLVAAVPGDLDALKLFQTTITTIEEQ